MVSTLFTTPANKALRPQPGRILCFDLANDADRFANDCPQECPELSFERIRHRTRFREMDVPEAGERQDVLEGILRENRHVRHIAVDHLSRKQPLTVRRLKKQHPVFPER